MWVWRFAARHKNAAYVIAFFGCNAIQRLFGVAGMFFCHMPNMPPYTNLRVCM